MFEDLHPTIMLATMAIFLFLIFLLNLVFYRPLLNFMDERSGAMSRDEERVRQNAQEMTGSQDELVKIHDQTREEIHKIKEEAIRAANEEAEQLRREKKAELEKKMAAFFVELEGQKNELREYLASHMDELALALEKNIKRGQA